jgi:hypothetical protein
MHTNEANGISHPYHLLRYLLHTTFLAVSRPAHLFRQAATPSYTCPPRIKLHIAHIRPLQQCPSPVLVHLHRPHRRLSHTFIAQIRHAPRHMPPPRRHTQLRKACAQMFNILPRKIHVDGDTAVALYYM